MSARITYSLSDENQSLHKQIGCMNGIFQIFDRRYFLGGRSMPGRNQKKLLPSPGHDEGISMEPNSASQRTQGKNQKKTRKEKQRVSTESSRTSFSSTTSCSSSFSSLDANNRAAHLETTLLSHVDCPVNTTRESLKNQHNATVKQLGSQSFEFRDIVKENMNREACAISVRTVAGEQAVSRKLKHVDSPRPMRQVEYTSSKNAASNESFRVLARFREAHRYPNEENDIPTHSAPKFNRRLSYDGRESYDTLKSTIKIRELPRLSLDSKESWARRSASGTRSNDLVKDLQKGNRDFEEPVSSRQSSTIVAKLMGLDALPDSTSTTNSPSRLINAYPTYEQNSFSRPTRKNDESTQQSRFSGSPRISHGDSYSPSLRNNHLGLKPNACEKLKVETTQASQVNRKDLNEQAIESHELSIDVPNNYSVYGEIEKRLSTLEFTKSGKDLRALKQILEAMQKSRAIFDKEQASECASQVSMDGTVDQNRSSGAASPRNSRLNNTASSARNKDSNSLKSYKSSIIIMKPAKHLKISNPCPSVPLKHDAFCSGKEQVKVQSTKDIGLQHTLLRSLPSHSQSQPFRDKNTKTRILKPTKDQHCFRTETSTASGNSPRVTSSRLHKKFGLEKQSCPTTPSSDSSRTERNTRKVGSCSTEIKFRQKTSTSNQKSIKKSSKSSRCPGDTSQQQGSVYPLKPKSNGATSNITLQNTINTQFDNTRSNYVLQDDDECEQRNAEMRLSNSITKVKPTLTISEQQSPVSVLDSTFYQDDSPSPIKKISYAFEDDETINSETESSQEVPVQSQKSTESLSTEIKNLKSEIDKLRKHIRQVNFSNEEEELLNDSKDHFCQEMNSQHKYIWQILSESGLLKDLDHGMSAIQLHSPGHLINPNLFLALEQSTTVKWPFDGDSYSKLNSTSEDRNKVQRKLVFDTVNEILLDKLVAERSSKHWLSKSTIAGTDSRGQQILKELCTQIDQLQDSNQSGSLHDYDDASRNMIWKDLMYPSRYWGNYQNDIPGIVLDIERQIFKDLITEIVMNEASFYDNNCREFPSN
ncbi:protein LONGIFOLIA 2 [Cucumis melo var. makuwa]|uniref:Protein LONGIFOLIA 2 n=1 Tax=Cucumis melo var. makuwa TaxID=1194695 RepID=A0A5A7T8Z5_CUCMM|nr:protein LONGIFOLIA 2 [Cucumis melo var. makuwa]TYK00622.1 protein LONGIFOLIA 2 [Cucumis melo var. makuwa]